MCPGPDPGGGGAGDECCRVWSERGVAYRCRVEFSVIQACVAGRCEDGLTVRAVSDGQASVSRCRGSWNLANRIIGKTSYKRTFRGITFPDFKLSYRDIVRKNRWHWHQNRQVDERN